MYRVPNNDRPPLPRKNYACQKKMKTLTGSPFNSTSLLKSPVVSASSNGATNNLKKEGRKKKKDSKAPKYLQIWSLIIFDASTCEAKLR